MMDWISNLVSIDGCNNANVATNSLLFGGIIAIIFIVYFHFSRSKNNSLSYPPEPPNKHWLWGHAPQLPSDGSSYDIAFLKMATQMGNASVFTVKLPIVKQMIIVSDPDLIHYITVTKNYNKSWTYKLFIFGPQSIVRTHGDVWKKQRKTFLGGFKPSYLKNIVIIIGTKLQRFLQALDQEATINNKDNNKVSTNMLQYTSTFTADVIVQVAFGEDWGDSYCDSTSQLGEARQWLSEMAWLSHLLANDPMVFVFGWKEKRRIKELNDKVCHLLRQVLERRLKEYQMDQNDEKNGNSTNKESPATKDICTLAIASLKSDNQNYQDSGDDRPFLSNEEKLSIVEQLKTFYFAGHDTTATTIAWASWLLSQYPTTLNKLRHELNEHKIFVGLKTSKSMDSIDKNAPTYEQINNCPYLDAIVKETLRLYPPAGSGRYIADPNESYNGKYKLGGAVLYINPYVMHRLPQYWENPNDFIPERFVNVSPDSYAHKFLPFLKGPRDCLGKYFAMLEAKLAIASLAQRYDMSCVDPNDIIGSRVTAYPMGGAKVYLSMRSSTK